jgi:hypothetical protein
MVQTAGVGLIDVPAGWHEDAPRRNGMAVGVALTMPVGFGDGGSPELRPVRLGIGGMPGQSAPVVLRPAHVARNCHPAGGRAPAVVQDGAQRYLPAARYVMERKRIGASIPLTCANGPGPKLSRAWPEVMQRLQEILETGSGYVSDSGFELDSIEFSVGIEGGLSIGISAKADASATISFKRRKPGAS